MKQFIGMLTLAATVGLMQRADAQEFNYNYLEVGAAAVSSKLTGQPKRSGQSFALSGSFGITDSVYATGGYSTGSLDLGGGEELETTTLGLGLGYHFEPSASTSIFTQALFIPNYTVDGTADLGTVEVTVPSVFEGNAYGVALGLRQRVGERVELEGKFTHLQIRGDAITGEKVSGDNNDLAVGMLFHTGMKVSVGGRVSFDIDSDRSDAIYGLGLRYHF